MKNSSLYTMGSPNSLNCSTRQISSGAGILKSFSLLVAWPFAPDAVVFWIFTHTMEPAASQGGSPGASVDLLPGCGFCCFPG